jgi:hypothetical protein
MQLRPPGIWTDNQVHRLDLLLSDLEDTVLDVAR